MCVDGIAAECDAGKRANEKVVSYSCLVPSSRAQLQSRRRRHIRAHFPDYVPSRSVDTDAETKSDALTATATKKTP